MQGSTQAEQRRTGLPDTHFVGPGSHDCEEERVSVRSLLQPTCSQHSACPAYLPLFSTALLFAETKFDLAMTMQLKAAKMSKVKSKRKLPHTENVAKPRQGIAALLASSGFCTA